MGTTAHIVVVGDQARALADHAVERLETLERRWSRFLPSSEVSRMNASAGEHVLVSRETLQLVRCAVDGWTATAGRFDPSILPALRALGYDRDFDDVGPNAASLRVAGPSPAPGCGGVLVDEQVGTVTLPRGVELDPGGIGKGFAADLVCDELIDAGARGALVNVGGDLRVRGAPPNAVSWEIAIADPARNGCEVARVALLDGAVATSSRARRRWQTAAGTMHHLVDPRTGFPARTRHVTVSVVAGAAWWAEVVSTAVLVSDADLDDACAWSNAHILAIDDRGSATWSPAAAGLVA